MQFGIFQYTSLDLTMEFVESFVETQDILFYEESMYSSVSVLSFDDGTKVMKLSGKNQCSDDPSSCRRK